MVCQKMQVFEIIGYKLKGLNWWQKRYRRGRAQGVWVPIGKVAATNPWMACAVARRQLHQGVRYKLKAIPTWQEPGTTMEEHELYVTQLTPSQQNVSYQKKDRVDFT